MFRNRPLRDHEEFPQELKSLFVEYRSALPDFEGSPEFMPKLWEKIEGRQRVTYSFGRLARGFVTAAAALCMMFSAAVWAPLRFSPPSRDASGTYVEVLDDSNDDNVAIETAAVI